jgi:hypothetical protein
MSSRFSTTSPAADTSGIPSASMVSARMRSTTRPSRIEVDSTSVPDAEISTAGVIIAPRISPAPRNIVGMAWLLPEESV